MTPKTVPCLLLPWALCATLTAAPPEPADRLNILWLIAEDMGPEQLAAAAKTQADEFDADFSVVQGVDLLSRNFPAIHAVGRASDREPRLLR